VEGVEMKGVGSGWSRQTCQLHTTPGFQAFSSGKVMLVLYFINLGARGLTSLTCRGKGLKNVSDV